MTKLGSPKEIATIPEITLCFVIMTGTQVKKEKYFLSQPYMVKNIKAGKDLKPKMIFNVNESPNNNILRNHTTHLYFPSRVHMCLSKESGSLS